MKKVVALLLSLTLVVSMFAGCAKKEEATTEPKTEETTPVTEEETTDEGPTITLDDIRPLLQKKVANNRDAIKDKLEEFGAKNATSLDENYYVEFHEFLEGLK